MAFFSRLWRKTFFTDMTPILRLGAKRSLEAADLPDLPANLEPTAVVVDESTIEWTSARFLNTLLWASRRLWYWPTVLYLANAGLSLLGPVLVNHFIKRLEAGVMEPAALTEAVLYGLGVGGTGIVAGLCLQHYFYGSLRRQQVLINVVNTR
jgi:hypothetical protein